MSIRTYGIGQFFGNDVGNINREYFKSKETRSTGYGDETIEEEEYEVYDFYWGPNRMFDEKMLCPGDYNGQEVSFFAEDFTRAHVNTTLEGTSPFKLWVVQYLNGIRPKPTTDGKAKNFVDT